MPARGYEFYLRVVNSISQYQGKGAAFKGAIYYVTITTVISSHVISSGRISPKTGNL